MLRFENPFSAPASDILPYASACFQALRDSGLSGYLSIGGALGRFTTLSTASPTMPMPGGAKKQARNNAARS
ncbi:MAG: hypothetical protein N2117_06465 [Anaerolineales bacterium]|nr:hypothetical protein [Anaerolineales bacterium]